MAKRIVVGSPSNNSEGRETKRRGPGKARNEQGTKQKVAPKGKVAASSDTEAVEFKKLVEMIERRTNGSRPAQMSAAAAVRTATAEVECRSQARLRGIAAQLAARVEELERTDGLGSPLSDPFQEKLARAIYGAPVAAMRGAQEAPPVPMCRVLAFRSSRVIRSRGDRKLIQMYFDKYRAQSAEMPYLECWEAAEVAARVYRHLESREV